MSRRLWRLAALLLVAAPLPAVAASMAGVCPDGSAFVVRARADVPCSGARLVESSHLPPLRPEMLPKPYGWEIDQQRRDPHNPYNLIEIARKLRAAADNTEVAGQVAAAEPAPDRPAPPSEPLAIDREEFKDLVRLIALRQEIAPASFRVADAADHERMWIRLAHSRSFQSLALEQLGLDASASHVVMFLARAVETTDFHPNFLVSQGGITHRPDPRNPGELDFLVGEPGALEEGTLALGYFLIPARFDPRRPMDLWWNDRSLKVILEP